MKSSLLALAALGGASAFVLPPTYARNAAAEQPALPAPIVSRSSDSSTGYSVPLHSLPRRAFDGPGQAKAAFLSEVERVMIRYGNFTSQQRRDPELRRRQTIGLTNVNGDSQYFGQISIGTPAQNFLVAIDSGSSDFWLMSRSCGDTCQGRPKFNPSASSTYRASGTTFDITYGTGGSKGMLAADRVGFAGYEVHSQTFAVIDDLTPGATIAPASGILGMGFEALSESGATPFWEVLAVSGTLPEPLFTVQLARQKDNPVVIKAVTADRPVDSMTPGGIMTLGKIDPEQYSGPITYTDVMATDKWAIPLDSFTLNGKVTPVSSAENKAVIDTGTGLLAAPNAIVKSIYGQIPGSKIVASGPDGSIFTYWTLPCTSDIGSLSFSFGGKDWAMSSTDVPFAETGEPGEEGRCYGSLFGTTLHEINPENPSWIFGISFLKNVFQVYDGGFGKDRPARIGFAALKGPNAQTAATTEGAVTYEGQSTQRAVSASTTAPPLSPTQPLEATQTTWIAGMVGGSGLPAPYPGTLTPASPSVTAASAYHNTRLPAAQSVAGPQSVAGQSAKPSSLNSGATLRCSSFILAAVCAAAGLVVFA